jgi:Domain of unknown function (DUF4384)/Putative zinc-finger
METEEGRQIGMIGKKWCAWMKRTGFNPGPCPDMEILATYRERGLKKEEEARIEKHLASCDRCTEYLAVLSDGMDAFDSSQSVSVPEDIVKRASNLVRTSSGVVQKKSIFSWFSDFRPLPAMAAICVALLLALTTTVGLFTSDHGNQSAGLKLDIVGRVTSGTVTRGTGSIHEEVAVENGGLLHSGDMFKVRFEVSEDGYVYLLGLDSKGHLARLVPEKDAGFAFKVKAHQPYFVPEKDEWFRLDQNPGQEHIIMLLSSAPLKGFQQKIDQLKKSDFDSITRLFPEAEIRVIGFQHD